MKIISILLCCAGALGAQPTTVIQTETREVLVDAIVTAKNGTYIGDLTAKDFHISQDGKDQSIRGFSLESPAAASQTRSLVLFFDETSMEARDQIVVRQAASNFIDAEAGPNHRMAVVTFNGSMRIAQSFTDNAGRLKDALNQAGFHGLAASAADSDRSHDPSRNEEDRVVGRASSGAMATSMSARNMIRSLGELGRSLGVLPGRKIVIVFAGTLPFAIDPKSELRDAIEAANKSFVAFYPVDVRPVFAQTDTRDTPALPADRHPEMMQRGGQGPRGDSDALGAGSPDSGSNGQSMLFSLANGTGGFVVRNSNDLLGGLQDIGKEQDQYYVLTYVAPESKEGICHSLKVKVDRKGTKVRSRTSYCAEKPMDLLAGTSTGKDLENRAASTQPGNLTASMQLPYFYIPPGVARVNLAMDIAFDSLKFENEKGKLHAEINLLGIAAAADGEVGARFSDVLKLDFDNQAQFEKMKTTTVHYEKEFKIVPGEYRFTLAFSSGGASFGKLEMPLAVEARKPGALALSSVTLSRDARSAADLGLATSLVEDRTPLIAGGVQVIPTGSELFTKSDTAVFYFEVYDPNPASVMVHVRILDGKTGEPRTSSASIQLDLANSSPNSAIPSASKLPIDSLAPGPYRLEVTADNSAGQHVSRTANFEIK